MFKVGLITIMLLLFENAALQQLCSISKANNTCLCKRVTDQQQNLAISVADCARINLQNFPDRSQLIDDLNQLDLSQNEIQKLENQYISVTLRTLQLSYNYINYISDGFFNELPNLQTLILSHNNITNLGNGDVFRNTRKLLYLDLSFNNIKTLQDNVLLPLEKLQTLDLSYNDATLGESLTQSPDDLHVKLGLTIQISSLKMDNIGLKELHNMYFNNYTNLKYLSLADNYFENVPTIPYSVEYLDLSGSSISILQGKHLSYHSLRTFKLDRMKRLETVQPYAFYNLQSLEELSITDCRQLKEFNDLVFGMLTKDVSVALKKLSLAKNSLQTLNYTYKYLFKKLDYVDLGENPWNCDCNLLWFQEFDNFYKKENIRCSSPFYLSNRRIADIVEEDVPNCYPEKYGKKSHRILIPILVLLVIILSVLVGYLIYYAPSWYGHRSRGIGPQSPYSPTRTEED